MRPLAGWRQRLDPWIDALQFLLSIGVPPLPSCAEMAEIWVDVDYFPTNTFDRESWAKMAEALELLDLLWHVDAYAAWELLLETARVERTFEINEPALFDRKLVRPKYSLQLPDDEIQPRSFEVFQALRLMVSDSDSDSVHSTEYDEVKELLLDELRRDGREFLRGREGPIAIKPRLVGVLDPAEGFAPLFLREIQALGVVSAQSQSRSRSLGRRGVASGQVFVFSCIEITLDDLIVDDEVAAALSGMADRKQLITKLKINSLCLRDVSAADLFSKLLGSSSCEGVVQRLEIQSSDNWDADVLAVCNAIATSKGLVEVMIGDWSARNRSDESCFEASKWWMWLAYALFGVNASHGITEVTLNVESIRRSDVVSMREVIVNVDPLSGLECHAPLDRTGPTIKKLTLDYIGPLSTEAVLELLQLIGSSLEHVSLRKYGVGSFDSVFLNAVCESCPRLVRLDIFDANLSLKWLQLPGTRGSRKIESLCLEGRASDEDSFVKFFSNLGLVGSLKEFHCEMWRGNDRPNLVLEMWLQMLDQNRTLERSEAIIDDTDETAYAIAKYREQFQSRNGRSLHDPRLLAFLSVVSTCRSSSTTGQLQLNVESIKLIMEFALIPKRRICG